MQIENLILCKLCNLIDKYYSKIIHLVNIHSLGKNDKFS